MSDALHEYLRVKSGQPKHPSAPKRTVYIDGQTIGYQFNKQSMGSRIAHVTLHKDTHGWYCHYNGMTLRVQPISGSSQHFEATEQI